MAEVYVHIFPNNKLYFGITKNSSKRRWNNGKGYATQSVVYKAIQKYGWENIKHIILLQSITIEEAEECEKYLIKKYNTQNPELGYNLCEGGNTNKGYHHTEEYKRTLSQNMRGRYKGEKSPCYGKSLSEEQKQQISTTLSGRKQSDYTKSKRSESLKGHKVSEETRLKISNSHKGKKLSDEHKKHLSESLKGKNLGHTGYWKDKKLSMEVRQKMSESHKGIPKSGETRKKLSESCKGKKKGPMTEEYKRKVAESKRRRKLECLS